MNAYVSHRELHVQVDRNSHSKIESSYISPRRTAVAIVLMMGACPAFEPMACDGSQRGMARHWPRGIYISKRTEFELTKIAVGARPGECGGCPPAGVHSPGVWRCSVLRGVWPNRARAPRQAAKPAPLLGCVRVQCGVRGCDLQLISI